MPGLGWRKTHDMHCIHASDALSAKRRYRAAISASVSGRAVTPVSAAGCRLQHRHHRRCGGNRLAPTPRSASRTWT